MHISYYHLILAYLLGVGLAIALFLAFFTCTLIRRGGRSEMPQPQPPESPSWLWASLNFVYPSWLDRLSFRQILQGFVWALGSAAVVWALFALLFLMMVAKPHGR